MADSRFARDQLKKHGWSEGRGLGKDESGMKEAIKVKIKNNKTGIGHDPGAEFTTVWWQDVFNKTASRIHVEAEQDGTVTVKQREGTKKEQAQAKKTELYGHFVKGATLTQEGGRSVELATSQDSTSSSSDEDSPRLTEELVFQHCEGRTAHKGARHGLGLSGKLNRVENMERQMLLKMGGTPAEREGQQDEIGRETGIEDYVRVESCSNDLRVVGAVDERRGKKKKKKKRKRNGEEESGEACKEKTRDDSSLLCECEGLGDQYSEAGRRKKEKKKREPFYGGDVDVCSKKRKGDSSRCDSVQNVDNMGTDWSKSSKKKRKKKKHM